MILLSEPNGHGHAARLRSISWEGQELEGDIRQARVVAPSQMVGNLHVFSTPARCQGSVLRARGARSGIAKQAPMRGLIRRDRNLHSIASVRTHGIPGW